MGRSPLVCIRLPTRAQLWPVSAGLAARPAGGGTPPAGTTSGTNLRFCYLGALSLPAHSSSRNTRGLLAFAVVARDKPSVPWSPQSELRSSSEHRNRAGALELGVSLLYRSQAHPKGPASFLWLSWPLPSFSHPLSAGLGVCLPSLWRLSLSIQRVDTRPFPPPRSVHQSARLRSWPCGSDRRASRDLAGSQL